jgi:hypothetical protein
MASGMAAGRIATGIRVTESGAFCVDPGAMGVDNFRNVLAARPSAAGFVHACGACSSVSLQQRRQQLYAACLELRAVDKN